jgi:hypothetical protein
MIISADLKKNNFQLSAYAQEWADKLAATNTFQHRSYKKDFQDAAARDSIYLSTGPIRKTFKIQRLYIHYILTQVRSEIKFQDTAARD